MGTSRVSMQTMLSRGSHVVLLLWIQLLVPSQAQGPGSNLDRWGEWSVWSPCSSSCGPGLQTRSRHCGTDLAGRSAGLSGLSHRCSGASTERKACTVTDCPSDRPTAHEAACSRYNSRTFSGRQYMWEPFTHPPSPCKLACRARGQHFYANLAGTVQDGTQCGTGTQEAVCHAGLCKSVGCDGVIGSSLTRDTCGVCQGDGSSCSTIAGIFASTALRRGLNDVISIPAGSTNINITELEPSRNLLLLQTFEGRTILTGNTRSPVAGKVSEAGTVFTFSTKTRTHSRGSIYAPGPTNVGIKLKLLLRDRNPGIEYKFNVKSENGGATLRQINRSSQPVRVQSTDDAIRDRMGVSGFGAGPEQSYQRTQEVTQPETTRDDSSEEMVARSNSESIESEDGDVSSTTESSEEDELGGDPESIGSSSLIDDDQDPEESDDESEIDDKVEGEVLEDVADVEKEEYGDTDGGRDRDEIEEDEYEKEDDEDEDDWEEEADEGYENDENGDDGDDDDVDEVEEDTRDETNATTGVRNGHRRNHISNTLSDERSSSDGDDDYEMPKYSQSFSFGKRYESRHGNNTQRLINQGSRQTAYGETKRSGRVVSFGLKYVDDKNGNANNEEQTVTVGSVPRVAKTDYSGRTYSRSYTPLRRSNNRNTASDSTAQGTIRRTYQPRSGYYPTTPRRIHQHQRGSQTTDRRRIDDSRRRELLRRQRQRQRERELYNQRLREYREQAVRRREAELARRRQLERERYETSRQRYNTVPQDRPTIDRRIQNVAVREGSTGITDTSKLDLQKPSIQSNRGPIIRHYGEDGLYASGEDVKAAESTPDSVEIFKPADSSPQSHEAERIESEPTLLTNTGRIPESPSSEPGIISRVRTNTEQDEPKPEIIPRVAQSAQRPRLRPRIISRVAGSVEPPTSVVVSRVDTPVEQPRPDIIPRVRTTGPLDNTGGRRPSIISALSGGEEPVLNTRDFPSSAMTRPQPVPEDRGAGDALYIWRISGFTMCTMTCGGGVQQTVVVCVDKITQAVVTDENCRQVQRPNLTAVKCNTRPCPAEWAPGPWTACSASCGGGERTRTLTCQSRVSPTLNLTVSSASCADQQHPVNRERCGLDPCNSWRTGNWSQCSARCGEGVRTRPVDCVSLGGDVLPDDACSHSIKPGADLACDNGPCGKGWFYQEWPEECPVACGEGEITRVVFCSGESNTVLPDERCDPNNRPETHRKCRSTRPCGGQWFTGPWSKCAAKCGPGQKSRDVICIKSLSGNIFASVDEENCLPSEKPADTEPCEGEPCQPEWYTTSWSQCSKSCDTGYRSREVKCLSPEQTPSDQCPTSRRPNVRNSCNTQSCATITNNETRGPEPSDGCVDTLPGCPFVKKARMCRYAFYKQKCCKSCSEE